MWTYGATTVAPHGCPNLTVFAAGAGFTAVDLDAGVPGTGDSQVFTSCDPLAPRPLPGPLASDGTVLFADESAGVSGFPLTCTGICPSTFTWSSGQRMGSGLVPLAGGAEAALVAPDGHLAVVDAQTGAAHWTGALGAAASLPPAVTDTTIFAVADDGTLSAFPVGGCGASTCPATWTAALPSAATGRPSIVGDVLYVGGSDGSLSAFAAAGCGASTCSPRFTATVPGAVAGSPVADGGTLYVGSSTGTITAFRAPA